MPRPKSLFDLIEFPNGILTFQELYEATHWWNDIGTARLFIVSGYSYVCASLGIIGTRQLVQYKVEAHDAAAPWKQALPFNDQWIISGSQLKRAMGDEPMCLIKALLAISSLELAAQDRYENYGARKIDIYQTLRIKLANYRVEGFNDAVCNDLKLSHPRCFDDFRTDLLQILAPSRKRQDSNDLINDMAQGKHVTKDVAEAAARHFAVNGAQLLVVLARRDVAGAVKPASMNLKFESRPLVDA